MTGESLSAMFAIVEIDVSLVDEEKPVWLVDRGMRLVGRSVETSITILEKSGKGASTGQEP